MGLKERNNPLGQRMPSDKVGGPTPLKHGQSAELVEEVKRKAREESQKAAAKPENASESQKEEYDPAGPDRQPGRVMKQSRLGTEPRTPQKGEYTQDNEEEPDTV